MMVEKTIGELCNVIGGKPAPTEDWAFENGFVPFLRMRDLGAYHLTNNLTEIQDRLNIEYVKKKNLLPVKKGALLLPRSGSVALNHRAILGVDAVIVSHICALEILNEQLLDKEYFYYYMSTVDMSNITKKTTGLDAITFEDLRKIKIPIPKIEVQRKIAKSLKEVDRAREQRKAANALTDQFLQSSFFSLFGDPVKNEKGFKKGTIKDLVSEVKYGTSKPAEENGTYPYLRMNNITYEGNWDFTSMKYINLEDDEREKYLLKKGDVVFNRTNSKELVGKTAVYNLNDEMVIAGYLIRVRTNEKSNPYYISGYLNSEHGKSKLFAMCKNIVGMANINAQELQGIEILMPPLSLQQQFAGIVAQAEQLRQKQRESEKELENLFQALLQKYFG